MDSKSHVQRQDPNKPPTHGSEAPSDQTPKTGSIKTRPPSTSRTNIRSACIACRRRRSKCSGGIPCDRCRALGTDCFYNEGQDGRTRALRDRGREELEMHKRVVDSIFRAVREGREQDLLSLIRGNAPLDIIAAAFEDSDVSAGSSVVPFLAGHHQGMDGEVDGISPRPAGFIDQSSLTSRRSQGMDGEVDGISPRPAGFIDQSSLTSRRSQGMDEEVDEISPRPTGFIDQTSLISQGQSYLMRQSPHMAVMPLEPPNLLYQPHSNLDPNLLVFPMVHLPHQHDTTHLQRLSIVYTSFRDIARHLITTGVPISSVLGDSHVPCDVFLSLQPVTSSMSVWVYALVNSVQGVDILFRLAWFSYITRFLRWIVQPSKEYYDQMPLGMIPTQMQLQISHAPVIDLVPIPMMRDRMLENFRDFVAALDDAGATVHWEGTFNELFEQDPVTGNTIISAQFERQVSDVNNFYFGRKLLDTFPELEGHVQIANVDKLIPDSQVNSPARSLYDSVPP